MEESISLRKPENKTKKIFFEVISTSVILLATVGFVLFLRKINDNKQKKVINKGELTSKEYKAYYFKLQSTNNCFVTFIPITEEELNTKIDLTKSSICIPCNSIRPEKLSIIKD